jgi:hypothetical protein
MKKMVGHRFNDTKQFGKDHWSMFAYIECRCVDNKGILDRSHLRLDGRTYPTRLLGYFEDNLNPLLIINSHNDLDCADDLEDCGLVENIGTGFNRIYKMTKYGSKVASQLREHKANGGMFANFKEVM